MEGMLLLPPSHSPAAFHSAPRVAEVVHLRPYSMAPSNAVVPLLTVFFLLPLLHVVDSRSPAAQMTVGFNTTFPPSPPTITPPPNGFIPPVIVPSPVTAKPPPPASSAPPIAPPVPFPTPVIVLPPPETTPPPATIPPPASKPPPVSIPSPVSKPPPASTPPPATIPPPVSKPPPVNPPPTSTPPPASVPPPVKKPPPVTSPSVDCNGACKARCSLSSRPNLCIRACGTCCYRCKCVPSGTAGHYEECPCYANQKTRNNRPKCP